MSMIIPFCDKILFIYILAESIITEKLKLKTLSINLKVVAEAPPIHLYRYQRAMTNDRSVIVSLCSLIRSKDILINGKSIPAA